MINNLVKIIIIFFTIFIKNSISYAVPKDHNGKGDILISKIMFDEFYDYIIGPISKQPEIFLISEDRTKFYKKTFRNYGQKRFINGSGNILRHKQKCQIKLKQNCYLFSNARIIVWDNGINPMKRKTSSIKPSLTKKELIAKLNELGFEVMDQDISSSQNILVLDENFGKN